MAEAGSCEPGHAQVHDLDPLVVRDEHVVGLHVAVHDAGGVDRREPGRDLARDLPQQRLGEPSQLHEQLAQGAALDVVHDEEVGLPPLRLRARQVEDPHDVLVADPLPDLGLAPEAPEKPRGLEQVRMDDLECDARAGRHLGSSGDGLGQDDAAHAAATQVAEDPIRAESVGRHGPIGQAGVCDTSPWSGPVPSLRRLLRVRPARDSMALPHSP